MLDQWKKFSDGVDRTNQFRREAVKKATDERTVSLEDIRIIFKTIVEKNHTPGAVPDD